MAKRTGNGISASFVLSVILAVILTLSAVAVFFLAGENGLISVFAASVTRPPEDESTQKTDAEIRAEKEQRLNEYRKILSSPYMLITDKTHRVPENMSDGLVEYADGILLEAQTALHLEQFISAASSDGVEAVVLSGYRSEAEQQQLYTERCNEFISAGYTDTERIALLASQITAKPGYSEHHTGFCVDIAERAGLTAQEAVGTDFYKYAVQHCAEYGFIISYSQKNIPLTGYEFKPWHFRYVGGREQAEYIMSADITLAAYSAFLTDRISSLEKELAQ